jgi:methionine synthase II (cobalamin-independent)
VNAFGFDLVSGPESIELIRELPPELGVQAGIVDARNTMLEPLDGLAAHIEELADIAGADRLRVSPSAGLEFLPREKARAKLERLSQATKKAGV